MAQLPNGFFVNDLILQGKSLSKETYLSKGVTIEIPDTRSADVATLVAIKEQINYLLAFMGDDYAMQVNWSVSSDYHSQLQKFHADTLKYDKGGTRWGSFHRHERFTRYMRDMELGHLRRERVRIYLGRKCNALQQGDLTTRDRYAGFIEQQARNFNERMARLGDIFYFGRLAMMTNEDHFLHATEFFNPSLATLMSGNREEMLASFDPDLDYISNCMRSDGVPFMSERENYAVFKMDDRYHALFVVRRWPKITFPGLMNVLTGSVRQDIAITQNYYPLNIEKEIKIEEDQRAELMKQASDPKKYYLKTEIERKQQKITALMLGHTLPYKVLTVIRVWDETLEGLGTKCLRVKTALQSMSGLAYHQCNQPAQLKNLFYETFPGFLGGPTRSWDIYGENNYLSDLVPLSSTFTGHLEEAEALWDSTQGGVVGARIFAGDTPQHATLTAMRGAGKSTVAIDLASQTENLVGFSGIIEEGMNWGDYARVNGYQSLVLRPDSDYTWNYFDTGGLPLSATLLSEGAALLVKMAGTSKDDDRNKLRIGLCSEYMHQLLTDKAEDWKNANEEEYHKLARFACTAELYRRQRMAPGTSFMDAYIELRDMQATRPDEYESLIQAPDEGIVVAFTKKRETADLTRNLVFTKFAPTDFPVHEMLCGIMRYGRKSHHRSARMTEELDMLVTNLNKWCRAGGTMGSFFDGPTNIRLTGRGLHAELGYLGEGETELKQVVSFLLTSRMRQHIVSLPRAMRKRMIYEELARFLKIPGSVDILKENYAQFRKFNCWVLAIFQQLAQIDDPALLRIILGNSTQYLIMRQNSRSDLDAIAAEIGLPESAKQPILTYPLPEHQRTVKKASYLTLFSKDAGMPVCGTVRVEVNPALLYVATSNGSTFDQRSRALSKYPDMFEGVMTEVQAKLEREAGLSPAAA